METMLHSESRRLYSWWWDSHISPKNSKWLQDNLADIDTKVKTMIKLIEEDADSFARRAEMYYKKRPELMKLVEEFYRAYRALAERYDHATSELRHAQKTIAAAFPNQVPFDDSASGSEQDPQTLDMLHPLRVLLNADFGSEESKKGLKKLQEMFGALEGCKVGEENERGFEGDLSQLCDDNQNLKSYASKAENEIKNLKKALKDLHSEKEVVLSKYEESMEKLSILEGELGVAKKSSRGLSEESCKAKVEVQQLKEALLRFEAEKDVTLSKLNEYRERITKLEAAISLAQKDEEGLMGRAVKAEAEAQCLEEELSKLKMKNNAVCREYEQCLEKVSDLERKLSLKQDEARLLNERADKAENEVRGLNKVIAEASDDKQSIVRRYEHCLEKMTKLESELSIARDDINRLNSAVKMKSEKLKNVEEKCTLLKASNQALELETDNLEKKITVKNEELSRKDEEIERLQSGLQNDHTLFVQAEDALQTLQSLYTKAQKEQKALALELKNGLKNLKEMKERNNGLEEEMKHVNNENKVLNESNSSSKMVMRNLECEILNLKEMKGRLENEVGLQMGLTNALHKEIHSLNENIEGLNTRYQDLIEQIESVGLNPKSLESSVKDLHDGNSKLRELCNKERDEKENLVKKLENMKQFLDKNATLESSLSASSGKLEKAHGKVKSLQDDKSSLVHEKAVILTQLQAITENMQKLLERNTFLENSLSGANAEISSLMEKAICLEDLCKSLNNDKSNLLNETSTLVLQLGDAEKRREELEKRYVELEKEKESTISLVEELKTCLDIEKQERAIFTFSSETRLNRLEDHVHLLQEDNRLRKKEFEEELDKAVNAQLEIFVLQRFIQDMEQKNMSLLLECQKHVEASKLSDKVISELESENLEQQVEAELLLDEIKKLRMGIYQMLKALEVNPNHLEKMENDKLFFHRVVENIEDLKFSLTKYEFDKDLLLIENSVLLTLFGQLKLEASEFELEKNILQQDFKSTCDQLVVEQNEKTKVLDINRQLTSDVKLRDQQTDELKIEIEKLCEEQREMKRAYVILGDEHSRKLEENKCMLKSLLDLKVKNSMVEEENDSILIEALALDNTSKVFELFGAEKAEEAKSLLEDLEKLDGLKRDLENEVGDLKNELEVKETENSFSKKEVEKLGEELNEVRDINSKLTRDISIGKYFSNQKKVELLMVTEKLKAKEEVNSQLCRTVDELKRKNGETVLVIQNLENHYLYLFEENKNQETEIENLRDFNGSLEFEVGMLREEVEERKIREEKLSSELKEISNQLQMWEPKAEKFYFDCQISNVREVFLENKVRELICVCEMLGNERDSRMIEIEQTKERVSFLESENGGLKRQLSQYNPIIDSLRDDIMSIEQNIICRQEQHITGIHTSEDNELEANRHGKSSNELIEDDEFLVNRISELQQLQNRINQVEKVVKEEMKRRSKLKRSKTNTKLGAAMREIEELKANYSLLLGQGKQKQKSELSQRAMRKTKPEILETKNGMIMTKDIQLDDISNDPLSGASRRRFQRADDQMLEQWETSEDDHSLGRISKKSMKKAFGLINMSRKFENVEPRSVDTSSEIQVEKELGIDRLEVPTSGSESTHNRNKKKVLERLICDAHKLKSIQTTVEDLRSKMQANKLQKKKAKNFDFEMLHEQFEEVEDTIIQLVEVNEKLRRSVEEHFAYSDKKATPELEVIGNLRRKRVVDQARKGTEKIGRLLIEVQKIQYALLKLEDEKKTKGKIRFPKSKASIILRDFITGRRRSSQKKKNPYFGCLRNKTNGEDTSIGEFTYLRYE